MIAMEAVPAAFNREFPAANVCDENREGTVRGMPKRHEGKAFRGKGKIG